VGLPATGFFGYVSGCFNLVFLTKSSDLCIKGSRVNRLSPVKILLSIASQYSLLVLNVVIFAVIVCVCAGRLKIR